MRKYVITIVLGLALLGVGYWVVGNGSDPGADDPLSPRVDSGSSRARSVVDAPPPQPAWAEDPGTPPTDAPGGVLLYVIGPDDGPVQGVTVRKADSDRDVLGRTNEIGEVRVFPGPPVVDRPVPISLDATGFAPRRCLIPPEATELTLRLARGKILEGQALGPGGGPLAGASIRVWPVAGGSESYPWGPWETESDEAGRFRFDSLPEDAIFLDGSHGHLIPIRRRIELREWKDGVTIEFQAGLETLAIVVTEDGRRVEGATVGGYAYPPIGGKSVKLRGVTTGKSGEARLGGIPEIAVALRLHADAPGFRRVLRTLEDREWISGTIELTPRWAETLLRGKVTSEEGTSLAGDLTNTYRSGGPHRWSKDYWIRTDKDGAFETRGIPHDKDFQLAFYWNPSGSGPSCGPLVRSGWMRLEPGEERVITLSAPVLVPVTVRCVTPDGEPVDGVSVEARPLEAGSPTGVRAWGQTLPGMQGTVELAIPVGTYSFQARAGDVATDPLEARVGLEGARVEMVVERGGSLEGRIIDSTGTPVAHRIVGLEEKGRSRRTATDDEGRFVFTGLRDDPVDVSIMDVQHEMIVLYRGAIPGQPALDLVFQTATISGRMADRRTGAPVSGTIRYNSDGFRSTHVTKTDTQGCYEIPEVPLGRMSLSARGPHHLDESREIDVQGDVVQDFRLDAGSRLRITHLPEGVRRGSLGMTPTERPPGNTGWGMSQTWYVMVGRQADLGPFDPGNYHMSVTAAGETRRMEIVLVPGKTTIFDWDAAAPR